MGIFTFYTVRRFFSVVFWFLGIVFFLGFSPSSAQEVQRIEIPSSPNPVGSGARALGMAGAFIAVADDATAASWNPGGLIQLEHPEISFVGDGFHRSEDIGFGIDSDAGGPQTISTVNLNYLSAAYPFTLYNRNMVVSLNYQYLYDFKRQWNFPLQTGASGTTMYQDIDYRLDGGLAAVGLAWSGQITPTFSVGITLNIWDNHLGANEWDQHVIQRGKSLDPDTPFEFDLRSDDHYTFQGFNANLGLLWNINSKLTLGAVIKLPFEADIDHEHSTRIISRNPVNPWIGTVDTNAYSAGETLDMPMSYGVGLAYRFSDALTCSFDIYRTEWSDFILTDSSGNETSPITGQSPEQSDIDATHQLRFGAEYLIIKEKFIIPIRSGVYYDPAPAKGNPDDIYGITFGSGLVFKRFSLDMAYQYRFGSGVGASILQDWDFSHDLEEHTLYSSIIVYF